MANASRPGGAGVRELTPKRSWGKVLFKTCILLVMAVVGAHWGWGKYAGARFENELARYRAAGEAIDPGDFLEPQPADDQNAALDLIAVGELLDTRSKVWHRFDRLEMAFPLDDREMRALGNVLIASKDALRRLDAAMTKPHVHWKQSYESPVMLAPDAWRSCTRNVPTLLRAAALRSHQLGDDHDALLRIRQLLFIAQAANRDPSLGAHLEAGYVRDVACDAIVCIAPDLSARNQAIANDLRTIIKNLSDDAAARQSLVRALEGERMRTGDFVRCYAAGRSELPFHRNEADFETRVTRITMLPFALNDAPMVLDHATRLINAARSASHWAAMRASVRDLDQATAMREYPTLHCLTPAMMSTGEWQLRAHFCALTSQHLAATVLAIRLYAADHDGRIPTDLEELVPDYLTDLPTDPMAVGGRRLGFIPASAKPMLYSVGDDGIDNGGDDRPIHERPYVNSSNFDWQTQDLIVHLSRQPRIRPENDDD